MKKVCILWLFMGLSSFASAQIITVRDRDTGEPIEMVFLSSNSPKVHTTTNARGQADITLFKGAESIVFRMLGYTTETKKYTELEAASFKLQLIPSSIDLGNIIVFANRANQSSEDVPSKTISISPKDVALQNPQTAADLLGISGKVFIQKSQQGGGSPMIRGFATNRLLYTVDGVRMNTAVFRAGNIQNVISLDPLAIENTEVLFGPGSIIYGSDAIGGVMSFRTLTPQLSVDEKILIKGKAMTRYSSANNERTAHVDIQAGWKKWAILGSFSINDFGDLRMGSDGPAEYLRPFYVERIGNKDSIITNDDTKVQRPSGYSQLNIMQKLRYKPNDRWDFQYGFHYSETSEYARYDRHISYRKGLPRYGEWNYGPQKWMMNNMNITHVGKNLAYDEMTIRLAHQYFEESRIDRDINKKERHIRIEKVDAYSINLDFTKSLATKNTLYYGVELVQNDVHSTGIDEDISTGIAANGPSRYPQSTWSSYGLYLSSQHNYSEQFLIQAGLRYNQYLLDATFDTTFYKFPFTTATINNGALTGSVGFVYRPTKKWVISSNYATAFRSPNVDDLGKVFDSAPGTVTVPNPDLKAEYAYSADLGIARVFGESVKIDLTGYYTLLEDALVRRDHTLNGKDSILYDGNYSRVQTIINAAKAKVYGIQAGLEVKLPKGFGISSDYNYQIGEEELDNGITSSSRHAAPAFGMSKITYASRKLSIQAYTVYNAKRVFKELPEEEKAKMEIYALDKHGNPWSPAWYTLNLKAMYQVLKVISISAGIENITDQRYRSYSSGIVAPGRNFVISLRGNF